MRKDTITYKIILSNNTGKEYNNITISDEIPAGLEIVSTEGTFTSGMEKILGDDSVTVKTVKWQNQSLADGESKTYSFQAIAVKGNKEFINKATYNIGNLTSVDSNSTYHKSKAGIISVDVPTEYLFAGVPNVSDEILSPNYKIVNKTEGGNLQVEVVSFKADETAANDFDLDSDSGKKLELKVKTVYDDSAKGFAADVSKETESEILSSNRSNVFTLGVLAEKSQTENGSPAPASVGCFKFVGKLTGYDALDMNLNEHAKFKMILRFTIKY